jgi:hypothetical protein
MEEVDAELLIQRKALVSRSEAAQVSLSGGKEGIKIDGPKPILAKLARKLKRKKSGADQ